MVIIIMGNGDTHKYKDCKPNIIFEGDYIEEVDIVTKDTGKGVASYSGNNAYALVYIDDEGELYKF